MTGEVGMLTVQYSVQLYEYMVIMYSTVDGREWFDGTALDDRNEGCCTSVKLYDFWIV